MGHGEMTVLSLSRKLYASLAPFFFPEMVIFGWRTYSSKNAQNRENNDIMIFLPDDPRSPYDDWILFTDVRARKII